MGGVVRRYIDMLTELIPTLLQLAPFCSSILTFSPFKNDFHSYIPKN